MGKGSSYLVATITNGKVTETTSEQFECGSTDHNGHVNSLKAVSRMMSMLITKVAYLAQIIVFAVQTGNESVLW